MPWSWSILGDLFGDLFSAGCLREAHPCGHVRSLLVYAIRDSTNAPSRSAGESVVDTLRRGVVLVPYSEFGKTTPNSSSASSTTPRESIRFRFRSDPDRLLDAFFFSGRLRNTPSRGRVVKISNTPSFYYSCRVRIWIIWWWGDVNLTSATLSAILGGPSETISSSSHRLILRFLAY